MSGAPMGGRPILITWQQKGPSPIAAQLASVAVGGVWGRPSRRAVARSPHPTLSPQLSGTRRGVGRPAPGGAGSRANPSFPPQKVPETGRGRPPRKRPLCEYSTPSAHPLGGLGPLGSPDADGGRRRGCLHPCHSARARRSSPGGAGRVGGLPSTPASPYIKGSLVWSRCVRRPGRALPPIGARGRDG